MGLMFVAGVTNVLWMGVVALYILVEKVVPSGHWVGRVAGVGLIGWRAWTLFRVVVCPLTLKSRGGFQTGLYSANNLYGITY